MRFFYTHPLFQFDDRDPVTTFLAHTIPEFPDQTMPLQVFPYCHPQGPGSLAMNDPDPIQTCQVRILQILVQLSDGFFGVFSPKI